MEKLINYRKIKEASCRYEFPSTETGRVMIIHFLIFLNPHSMARNLVRSLLEFTPGLGWGLKDSPKAKISRWVHARYHPDASCASVHSAEALGLSCYTYVMSQRFFAEGWKPSVPVLAFQSTSHGYLHRGLEELALGLATKRPWVLGSSHVTPTVASDSVWPLTSAKFDLFPSNYPQRLPLSCSCSKSI